MIQSHAYRLPFHQFAAKFKIIQVIDLKANGVQPIWPARLHYPHSFLESAIGVRQRSFDLSDYGRTEGEYVVLQIDLDFSIVTDLTLDHSF